MSGRRPPRDRAPGGKARSGAPAPGGAGKRDGGARSSSGAGKRDGGARSSSGAGKRDGGARSSSGAGKRDGGARPQKAPAGKRHEGGPRHEGGARPTPPAPRRQEADPRPPRAPKPGRRLPSDRAVAGRHAVEAVLRYQPARAKKLFVDERAKGELAHLAAEAGVSVERANAETLDALMGEDFAHQGAVLSCGPFPFAELEDVLEQEPTLILVLDGVEDPRNLGAAVRAAYSLGAEAVICPSRHSAPPSAWAHKTAAGALSRVPLVAVENLKRALEALKEKGIWIVGAEADGPEAPWQVDARTPTALVIGGEDRGLRRLTREACDHVVSIPMAARDMSLNAADAATVLLYEVRRQRAIDG